MTKVLDRLRNAGKPKGLPEDLGGLDARQKRGALRSRQERVKMLLKDAKGATGEDRERIRSELATVADEVRALREAGATEEPARARLAPGPALLPPLKRSQAEKVVSAIKNNWSIPGGVTLYADNLDEEQADELLELLTMRHVEGVPLDPKQSARFRALVTVLAGWDPWAEIEAEEQIQALLEEVRLEMLPQRVAFAEIGSVHLPASVFAGLRKTRSGKGWTVGDVGALTCLLGAFEARDAGIVQGGGFEEVDGELVLVAKGRELRFTKHVQPPFSAVGSGRVELDQDWLGKSGFLTFAHSGTRIEVRLGAKAKALREGRPS